MRGPAAGWVRPTLRSSVPVMVQVYVTAWVWASALALATAWVWVSVWATAMLLVREWAVRLVSARVPAAVKPSVAAGPAPRLAEMSAGGSRSPALPLLSPA